MTLRAGTIIACIAFGVTLAYYVGSRISTDALDLAVGVLCGMAASVPVSIGFLVALIRRRESVVEGEELLLEPRASGYPAGRQPIPQFIVLAPQPGQYPPTFGSLGYPGPMPSQQFGNMLERHEDLIDGREWRIIGDES